MVALACLLAGGQHIRRMDVRAYGALLAVGLVAAVFLEWAAQLLELWEYSAWMPTLEVLGRNVARSPIVQVTFLPTLSVLLAVRGIFAPPE